MKKVISIIVYVLFAVLFCMVLFVIYCNVSNKVAYIGKYSTVKIVSGSMIPTIPVDTFILVEKVDVSQIEVEDVILFYSTDPAIYGKLNTHRVVEITENNGNKVFTTKGDNNIAEDKYKVDESAVVGRYVKNLSSLTSIVAFLSKPVAFFIAIIIPSLLLVFFAMKDLCYNIKKIRHENLVQEEIERLRKEDSLPGGKNYVSQNDAEEKDKAVQEENHKD